MHVCVKMTLKGSKEALNVLIVTHVTQVERVESGVLKVAEFPKLALIHSILLNLLI